MGNNTPDSKLDETIKSTLNDYEAQYDPSDWARMETMLDAAPKAVSFKWSHALTVLIGVVVIGGGYALYNLLSKSTPTETKVETPATPIVEPPAQKKTITVTPPPVTAKKPAPETTAVTVQKPIVTPPVITDPKTKPATQTAVKEEIKKDKKKTEKTKPTGPVIEPTDKMLIMGNEPIFGDMLDSSKGIIGETKEKEETKKAAKAKKNNPAGWNQFMLPNVNVDSIRKNRERRDSLKNNND
jgi:outer membrane biosynthesis protein TonB